MKRRWLALALVVAFSARGDERIAAATNHLAGIIAGSNYTFAVSFGPQGALSLEGYAAGTSRAFRVEVNGRELLRVLDHSLWMPQSGTNGATRVSFNLPLIVGIGYVKGAATLSFGVVPPQNAGHFVAANYAGLDGKLADLPLARPRTDGWTFCETNEVGSCIELTDAKNPDRVEIALVKTEEDKSSVFIHSLRVTSGAPKQMIEIPPAERTATMTNFVASLTFSANLVREIQQAAMVGKKPDEVFAAYGRHLEQALNGKTAQPPAFPPPSILKRPPPGFPQPK